MATIKVVGIVKDSLTDNGMSQIELTNEFNEKVARIVGADILETSSSKIRDNYCKISFTSQVDAQRIVNYFMSKHATTLFLGVEVKISVVAGAIGDGTIVSQVAEAASSARMQGKQEGPVTGGSTRPPRQGGHAGSATGLKELESKFLDQFDTDFVRISKRLLPELLQKLEAVKVQCAVDMANYSETAIIMKGTEERLCNARRLLCQLTSLSVKYSLQRLVTEKNRFLKVSLTEQSLARQQWVGRRVLIRNSGELATIHDLRFELDNIFAIVRSNFIEAASEADTLGQDDDGSTKMVEYIASEIVCWDRLGLIDSVTVLCHSSFSAAYLQRIFGVQLGLQVEQIDFLRATNETAKICRICFDICLDPNAPAKAVASLHGVKVDGFRLHVLISAPDVPVRLVSPQPCMLRFAGPVALSEQTIESVFPPGSVKKIGVGSKSSNYHIAYVTTVSSVDAIEFRRRPLPSEIAAFSVVLDCSKLHILHCQDVPFSLTVDKLMMHLKIEHGQLSRPPLQRPDTDHLGYKIVTFTFQPGSGEALKYVRDTPYVHIADSPEDKQLSYYHTAKSLVSQIVRENSLELAQLATLDDSTDSVLSSDMADNSLDGGGSNPVLTASVAGSKRVEQMEPEEAIAALTAIEERCRSKERLTKEQIEEVSTSITKIVGGVWPRVHKSFTPCFAYKAFELGNSNKPCPSGFLCRFQHALISCVGNDAAGGMPAVKCKGETKCSRVHSTDIQSLLRLDIDLCGLCTASGEQDIRRPGGGHGGGRGSREGDSGSLAAIGGEGGGWDEVHARPPSFGYIQDRLFAHRAKMLQEADALLAVRETLKTAKAEEFCQLECQVSVSIDETIRKAASLEAMRSRISEVELQINEFRAAKASFEGSGPFSFRAARQFAREVYNRFKSCLPIYAERQAIIDAIRDDFSVLILSAETGSGKSTQVVQYISELVPDRVLCTQPRKVAAVTLADRVAEEMRTRTPARDHPNLVACRQPGGADSSRSSILFMTDASLLKQLYYNPELPHVSAVIVDEVHERSVNTDLLIALLRRTLQLRARKGTHPFKVVLTSATMNDALFAAYFARNQWDDSCPTDDSRAPVLKVGGRTFPVEIHFEVSDSQSNYGRAAEEKVLELHKIFPATNMAQKQNFDFLVFLTQADEVDRLAAKLQQSLPECICVPLHGSLEPEEQQRAFEKIAAPFARKIVVSTNIAETSVTIDGIGIVIDTGLAKQARYDPSKDATVLAVDFIAQSSAKQRAGRAGRTAAGDCYRLYSKSQFEDMNIDTPAELLRSDAAAAILSILYQLQRQRDWITDIRAFPFVEHPGEVKLEKALKLLLYLGAIDSNTELTPIGSKMAKMSTSPRVSAILFAGQRCGVPGVLSVALGMSQYVGNLFRRGKTDEEKEASVRSRAKFAADFPNLGDVGMAVAVWLEAKEQGKAHLKAWCNDNYVNYRIFVDSQKTIRSMLQEMLANDMDESNSVEVRKATKSREKGGMPVRAEYREGVVDVSATLEGVTQASFSDKVTLPKMLQSFMAGYFANLAFYMPPRQGDENAPPSYFLPGPNQLGFLGSAAAFRMSKRYPEVVIYMEIVDNRRLYISSLIGIDMATFRSLLPPTFQESAEFATFMRVNERRQMLARPAIVATTCPSALRQFYGGPKRSKANLLVTGLKQEFNLTPDTDLLIEVDFQRSQLLIMCSIDEKKHLIASKLQGQLDEVRTRLETRIREWALPGTNIRAVIGAGGACKELLLRPMQSIGIRFVAEKLSQRLSEPIAAVKGVPSGFFASLVDSHDVPSDTLIEQLFTTIHKRPSSHLAAAKRSISTTADLRSMSHGQVLAAIEYTAGAVCYLVNPFLRACNEVECRKYEVYIKALNSFHKGRSAHKANKRGEMLVYRGCPIPNDQAATYSPGTTVVWPSFTSTTTDEKVATAFSDGGAGQVPTIFEIATPFYCPLQDISIYPAEREILLPAFSIFAVESAELVAGSGVRKVRMRHLKDPPREVLSPRSDGDDESARAMAEAVKTGCGPIVINVPAELSKPAGLASVLEKELLKIDPNAEIDVSSDEGSGRVWGRGFFSTTALAAKACAIFNTSILGDRELAVLPTPVETDVLPFTSRVLVSMSAVTHSGCGSIDCGTEGNAQAILQRAQLSASPTKNGIPRKLNPLTLADGNQVKVGVYTKGKGGVAVPTMVSLVDVPKTMTVSALAAALEGLQLGLRMGAVQLQKDKTAAELESKSLKQSGVDGTRKRIAYLSSLVAAKSHAAESEAGLDHVAETGLDRGAQYSLWFHSSDQAVAAIRKLNGQIMPGSNLVVSASLDNSCSLVFSPDIYRWLKSAIQGIQDAAEGVAINVKELTGKKGGFVIKMESSNMTTMADAYRKLKDLQSGTVINVSIHDRGKLFPPKWADEKCAKVAQLFKDLSSGCLVRPLYAQSVVRVIGPPAEQLRVATEINRFLSKELFESKMRIPVKAMGQIKELLRVPNENVVVQFNDKNTLMLKSLSMEKLSAVRSEVSATLEANVPDRLSLCSVCYEVSENRFGTCGHTLCEDCGQQYCQSSVCESRIPLTDPSCGQVLLLDDVYRMSNSITAVNMAGVRSFLRDHGDLYCNCHTPDCPQILDKRVSSVLCSVCMTLQCPLCGEYPHIDEACESARQRRIFEQSADGQASIHANAIIGKLLTPACPKCAVSFVDFSGCFAVSCGNCPTGFCGFCLQNCGRDAHAHVASCPFAAKHFNVAGYWHPGDIFTKCMSIRLPELVKDYLVKNMSDPSLQQVVFDKCVANMDESPFFDTSYFLEIQPHLKRK